MCWNIVFSEILFRVMLSDIPMDDNLESFVEIMSKPYNTAIQYRANQWS
jgi:hypothetical protein